MFCWIFHQLFSTTYYSVLFWFNKLGIFGTIHACYLLNAAFDHTWSSWRNFKWSSLFGQTTRTHCCWWERAMKNDNSRIFHHQMTLKQPLCIQSCTLSLFRGVWKSSAYTVDLQIIILHFIKMLFTMRNKYIYFLMQGCMAGEVFHSIVTYN